ncbi:hypothetical protein [Mesorhizobium sp. M1B.F.Ca.ET.045.04.1.1]|uniref:hypothetical protein n=1 Tax=Mesorhizobium sp. M1B.F.Ca.ET.045.04.1.1 TaxID=2493673 RepID=UPI000F752806|nr:hypothetical protein [Mesorhizobium sp. M1B.F.Ca.ET.045.04.1.1]AZO29326.1 hypothetical protein EJ071_19360 [Mesorhizobium sp. M1B.F.Ca.ET.045.04.1.1]
MSDARSVKSDTLRAEAPMRALADTKGMEAPEQAKFWLEGIAAKMHRGPRRDTWTSARDRAAEFAGIEISMAKRIWQRWEDMKDVSGSALVKLMIAYERICETNERAADSYRAERLGTGSKDATPYKESRAAGLGMDAAHH